MEARLPRPGLAWARPHHRHHRARRRTSHVFHV